MVLRFTRAQFSQPNEMADSAFETRLVRALALAMEKILGRPDEPKLLELTRQSRLRAAALGIAGEGGDGGERDVAVFALFLVASSGFEKSELTQFQRWVTPFLQRASSPGTVKVALAEQMLRSQAGLHPLAARLCEMLATVRTAVTA